MLETSQSLQQKVDDGSVAFTYPLDTSLGNPVKELHWDGVYFWSLEEKTGGLIIRRWAIDSFICKQQQKFELTDDATHTYAADSFAVEHYRLTVAVNDNGSGGYTTGLSSIQVSDNSVITSGDVLTFVRRDTSSASRFNTQFVEQATVQSTSGATQVVLTAVMSGDPHGDGKGFRGPDVDIDTLGGSHPPTPDSVYVTKFLWMANDNAPNNPGTPSLYKMRPSTSLSNVVQFSGTQYTDIGGMEFYTKYDQGVGLDDANTTPYNTTINNDASAGGDQTYILLARDTTLLFFNVSTNIIDRSMVMNNIKVSTVDSWPVFDMVVLGVEPNVVIYRLQLGTTYKNPSLVLTDESWATYNYEKQLIRRVVSSISIVADPSIIPADGSSTSAITAILRDQFNDAVPSGKTVQWSDDAGGDGGIQNATSPTDAFGEAVNNYSAGVTEKDVKITAAVQNGLIS
jgi:hypothetical protein